MTQELRDRKNLLPLTVAEFEEGVRQGNLEGVICKDCSRRAAGPMAFCQNCGSARLERVALASTGTIISYTIQWVAPEPFSNEAPYAWVIVQLDDGPRVTGWIPFMSKPDELKIGDRVRFTRSYRPGIVFEQVEEE